MHVRVKRGNPYGICNRVLKAHRISQPWCRYKFEDFTEAELMAYAREKKLDVQDLSHGMLVHALYDFQNRALRQART